jgi:ribosomal protein S6--L-glutamate ligase
LPAQRIGGIPDASERATSHDRNVTTALTIDPPRRIGSDVASGRPLVVILGSRQQTNIDLVAAWEADGLPAALLTPNEALALLGLGDTVVARLDVLPTLDGIETGVELLDDLTWEGVRVLNSRHALVCAHDKLRTAAYLATARLPHPKTVHLPHADAPLGLTPPLVLKPRHGSWGADVFLCETTSALEAVLDEIRSRPWFLRHGALLQEVVQSEGRDLRILVAGGRVVGAIERVAAAGEWRTNVALGASREPVTPDTKACELAIAAQEALGADFVGVDLVRHGDSYVILELNGAVDFDNAYPIGGRDVYEEIAVGLGLPQPAVVGA